MKTPKDLLNLRASMLALTIAAAGAAIGFTTIHQPDNDDEADAGEQVTVIKLSEAPAAVREAFASRAEGGKATRVERIVVEEVTKFEIEYDAKAGPSSMTFTDHGQVMEVEGPIADGALPEAVVREIMKDHPGATIKHADAVQVFFYEIEVQGKDGKSFEVVALPTGDIEGAVFGGESGEGGNAKGEGDEHGEHADKEKDHDRGDKDDDEGDKDDD